MCCMHAECISNLLMCANYLAGRMYVRITNTREHNVTRYDAHYRSLPAKQLL